MFLTIIWVCFLFLRTNFIYGFCSVYQINTWFPYWLQLCCCICKFVV